MRYKNNVLDKLNQIDTIANRINVQINRGGTQEQVIESIEMLKEAIENARSMVSIEADDFDQQFRPQ
jgi:histone acetyltransferase (RNA polymerase elongator complex component)